MHWFAPILESILTTSIILVVILTTLVAEGLRFESWVPTAMSIGLVVIITTLLAEGRRFESWGALLLFSVSSLVL